MPRASSPSRSTNPARHELVQTLADSLRRRCRVSAGARVLVAVSGGPDSVALLRGLHTLASRREWRLQLSVGHVQHHLREQAEADARFVEELAKTLKLPFLRAELDLKVNANGEQNLEARARDERYDALLTMARAIDADVVATAHHGDDQMETLLMRLLRGTSVRGLRGMPWRRPLTPVSAEGGRRIVLIRPLLALNRAEIDAFLVALKQPACIDHTNADVSRLRARLRRDVMPVLREVKPDIAARAAALADHLRQVECVLDDAISAAADRVVIERRPVSSTEPPATTHTFDRTDARALRPVVLTGLLRRLLVEVGVEADRLSSRAMAPLLRAIRDRTGGKRTFDFQDGARVTLTSGDIRVQSRA